MNNAGTKRLLTLIATACLVVGARAEGIKLSSPLEKQVFQRNAADRAEVRIQGSVGALVPEVIEAKADLTRAATRGKGTEWTTLAQGKDIAAGKFEGTLSLPAGGWYALTIRARKGAEVIAEQKVERVGAGDVFITAGQSNSANFGSVKKKAKDDRVVYFNGQAFVPAEDPIPGGFGGGGSPWALLGDQIVAATGVPVCFRSVTLDYSPVKDWLPRAEKPKQPYYKTMIERSRWFGKNGVRAVLWHQGESDTLEKTSAQEYADRLTLVIQSMRKDLGYDVDWFVAGASFHTGSTKAAQEEVARGQQLLWKAKVAFKGPVTDDLLKGYRSADGVHFSEKGLEAHAARWFEALAAAYRWSAPASREDKK